MLTAQHKTRNQRAPMRSSTGGFNHNIIFRGVKFHVQTELSSLKNRRIESHVFVAGRILASRRVSLAGKTSPESVVCVMKDQHRELLRDLVSNRVTIPDDILQTAVTSPRPPLRALPPPIEPPVVKSSPPLTLAPTPKTAATIKPRAATKRAPSATVKVESKSALKAESKSAPKSAPKVESKSAPSIETVELTTRRTRVALDRLAARLASCDQPARLRAVGVAIAIVLGENARDVLDEPTLDKLLTLQRCVLKRLREGSSADSCFETLAGELRAFRPLLACMA